MIRARETIAASAVQGSEPHFLGFRDFGFSKSAEETFRAWGEREILRRMVLQIRRLRPDVIITNHDTASGHGHHQATGRTVVQAFFAAADPKEFPEQLTQVTTWQVQRLFVRSRGQQTDMPTGPEAPPQFFTIDPNETDPIRQVQADELTMAPAQLDLEADAFPLDLPAGDVTVLHVDFGETVAGTLTFELDAAEGTRLDVMAAENVGIDNTLAPAGQHSGFRYTARGHGDVHRVAEREVERAVRGRLFEHAVGERERRRDGAADRHVAAGEQSDEDAGEHARPPTGYRGSGRIRG